LSVSVWGDELAGDRGVGEIIWEAYGDIGILAGPLLKFISFHSWIPGFVYFRD